ncbi:MAG: YbhB/YbcL family Raf kinase inhibitor-like protein [Alphaproteobacteria bacterium]|nr:YbhB/YbcL family Raf kinase inhibitor-like protein [Alphaproteobacteria bacterium]
MSLAVRAAGTDNCAMLRPPTRTLFALLAAACSSSAPAAGTLVADRPEMAKAQMLLVSSPAMSPGAPIALGYSAYGRNELPPLSWSALPAGTQSLAIVVEDPDASSAQPFVHWTAWNIAPSAHGLPEGLAGAVQGRNGKGTNGWWGPHPSDGKLHHYHFQLFALDTKLAVPAAAGREALAEAMAGHVLGKGKLVGTFIKPKG